MHTDTTSSTGSRPRVILLTAATLFALSPVLFEWTLHLINVPAARYAAIFPVLFILGIRNHPPGRPHPDGYLFLLAAVLVEVVCIGGGFPRWGRLAVPLATIGLCRASGLTSRRGAYLMLWFVPLPHFLESAVWPEGILAYVQAADWLLPPFDLQLAADSVVASKDGLRLALRPSDLGLSLMAALTGLAYFDGWQKGEFPMRTLARMLTWGLIAVPLQWTTVLVALLLLQWGEPAWGRILLGGLVWAMAAVLIFLALRPMRNSSDRVGGVSPRVPSA